MTTQRTAIISLAIFHFLSTRFCLAEESISGGSLTYVPTPDNAAQVGQALIYGKPVGRSQAPPASTATGGGLPNDVPHSSDPGPGHEIFEFGRRAAELGKAVELPPIHLEVPSTGMGSPLYGPMQLPSTLSSINMGSPMYGPRIIGVGSMPPLWQQPIQLRTMQLPSTLPSINIGPNIHIQSPAPNLSHTMGGYRH